MDLKNYFRLDDDLSSYEEAVASIEKNARFRGASLWILIFAIFIASLGLNVNSTAVIIGAMLISPLMGPIIGMGLAVGIDDLDLLRLAGRNYLVATVVAIVTATVYFLLSPLQYAGSELLARTSPTLYDVLIAFFGGAAGILALCIKERGNVLPGVAIATALMPPLCTAGFGLAIGNFDYFLGAIFLYFINTVFIALSTVIGVRMMHFPLRKFIDPARKRLVHRTLMVIVVLTMIPAAIMTWNILRKSYFNNQVSNYIKQELNWDGTQVLTHNVGVDSTLRVVIVGRMVNDESIQTANQAMNSYPLLVGYTLRVLQGSESDSIMSLTNKLTNVSAQEQQNTDLLKKETLQNAKLSVALQRYQDLEELTRSIAPEFKIFYPEVESLSLSSSLHVGTEEGEEPERMVTAIVRVSGDVPKAEEQEKIKRWLEQRAKTDDLEVVYVQGKEGKEVKEKEAPAKEAPSSSSTSPHHHRRR